MILRIARIGLIALGGSMVNSGLSVSEKGKPESIIVAPQAVDRAALITQCCSHTNIASARMDATKIRTFDASVSLSRRSLRIDLSNQSG